MISEHVSFYNSPVGCLKIQFKNHKVYSITKVSKRSSMNVSKGKRPFEMRVLKAYLDKYFVKGVTDTKLIRKVSFYASGTVFQQKVWKELKKIPYGETRTYAQVARKVGSPQAFRAVGSACGRNPFLLFVPCHRVVAQKGLGGFALGLKAKSFLLSHEQVKK